MQMLPSRVVRGAHSHRRRGAPVWVSGEAANFDIRETQGTQMTQAVPGTRTPEPPFQGSRVLIYGAAQGIGRAVALEFARRGADVAVADIKLDGARETARLIEAVGGRAA